MRTKIDFFKKNNLLLISILLLLAIPFISADESSIIIPHKQNTILNFSITSNNATSCNLTTIDTPTDNVLLNLIADKNSQTFNFTIGADNFSTTGIYQFNIECYDGATYQTGYVKRDVTPSGSSLNSSNSLTLFGSLIMMIVISFSFLFIAFKSESIAPRVIFYSLSGLMFIMVILYTVVTIQQSLFGFDSILNGIETFWFVIKILIGVGSFALIVVVALIMIKAWKIKRGFDD